MIKHFIVRLAQPVTVVLFDQEEGQGMAEYGLILAGVALLAIVAVFLLGPKIGTLLNNISSSLS